MFGFLKKKIKETSEKIAEEIEEDAKIVSEEEVSEDEKQELEKEKKSFFKKLFSKKKKQETEEIKSIEEELLEEQEKLEKEKKIKETSEKIAEEIEEDTIKEEEPQEKIKEETKKEEVEKEKEEEEEPEQAIAEEKEIEEVTEEKIEEKEEPALEKEEPEQAIAEEKEIEEVTEEKIEEVKKETIQEIKEEIKEEQKEIEEPSKEEIKKEILNNQKIIGTNKLEKEKKILGIFKKKHKEKIPETKELEKELYAPSKPHVEERKKQKVEEPEIKKQTEEKIIDPTQKKKNIFAKLSEKIKKFNITDEKFDELFWDLEVVLLENNVAVEVIEKIKENLKQELENTKITRRTINEIILNNLKETIQGLFNYEEYDLLEKIKKSEKPYKILMLGVNGSGKTTTIGKLVKYFQDNNLTSIIAASDTFRAAAIQQIEEHANKLNTKLIKHDYGADPAAVSYDAIEHAKAKNIDVVIIDTAGRLHSNSNLMQELSKIIRVAKPDIKIFIGESITGNDCVEQAKQFNESVGIDGIILTKADVDEKGGAAISISYVTDKPIIFITTGQEYKDLKKFKPQEIIDILFNE